jgi:HEAT repeat protein
MDIPPTPSSIDLDSDMQAEVESKASDLSQSMSTDSDLGAAVHLRETCTELLDLTDSNTEVAVMLAPQVLDVLNHEFVRDQSSVERIVLKGVYSEAKKYAAKTIARLSRVPYKDPDITAIYNRDGKSLSTLISSLSNATVLSENQKVRAECVQALGWLSWENPREVVAHLESDIQTVTSAAGSAISIYTELHAKRLQNQYVGTKPIERSMERQMPTLHESDRLLACTRLIALLSVSYPKAISFNSSFIDQAMSIKEAGENNLLSQAYIGLAFDAADLTTDVHQSGSQLLSENTVRTLIKHLHLTDDITEGGTLRDRMAVARVLGEIIAIQDHTKYETGLTKTLRQKLEGSAWNRRFFVAKTLGEVVAAQSPITDDNVLIASLRDELQSVPPSEHANQAALSLGKEITTQSDTNISQSLRVGIFKSQAETQMFALIALGQVMVTEPPDRGPDLIDTLCHKVLDPDLPWRGIAEKLGILAAVRSDSEDKRELITDLETRVLVGDPADRHYAAVQLGLVLAIQFGDKDGHHILYQLRDQMREVTGEERAHAAQLLGFAVAAQDDSSDFPQVVRRLRKDVRDGATQRHVVEVLGEVVTLWDKTDEGNTINDVLVQEASKRTGENRERFLRALGESASVTVDTNFNNEFVRRVCEFKSRLEQMESGSRRVGLDRGDTAQVLGELVAAQDRSPTPINSFQSFYDHVRAVTGKEYATNLVGELSAITSDIASSDTTKLTNSILSKDSLDIYRDTTATLGHLALEWDDLANGSGSPTVLSESLCDASSLDERSRTAKTIAELARNNPSIFRQSERISTLVDRVSTIVMDEQGIDHIRVIGEVVSGQLRTDGYSELIDSLGDLIVSASDTRTRMQEMRTLGAVVTISPNTSCFVPESLSDIVSNPDHLLQNRAARAVGIVVASDVNQTIRDTIITDLVEEMKSAENDVERGQAAQTLGFALVARPDLYGIRDIPDMISEKVRRGSEYEQRVGARALGEIVLVDDDNDKHVIDRNTGDLINQKWLLSELLTAGVTGSWYERSVHSEIVRTVASANKLTTSQFVDVLSSSNGDAFDVDRPVRKNIIQTLASLADGEGDRHKDLRHWLEKLLRKEENPAAGTVDPETRLAATATLANLNSRLAATLDVTNSV